MCSESKSVFDNILKTCRLIRIVKRFNSTKIDHNEPNFSLKSLQAKFKQLDMPKYYDSLILKNPAISKLKRASVLVPISIRENLNENGTLTRQTIYTLTKRTDKMKSFKGDVCFIGGKRDQSDLDDSETALREAKEEANIDSNQLTILAQLCPIITFNQTLVTPIVAFFDKRNFNPVLCADEVEMIFEMPTERFLNKANHKMSSIKNENGEYFMHYFKDNINGKSVTTWGFTAFLCAAISSCIHGKSPDFELDLNFKDKPNEQNLNEYFEKFLSNKLSVSQAAFKK